MKTFRDNSLKLLLGIVILCASACDLEEANVNPNNPTDASIDVLLPQAQVNLVWGINDFAAQSTSTLMQYVSGTLNVQYNVTVYDYLPAHFQSTWSNHFYTGALNDLKTIIEKSTELGAFHYRGIAKIQTAIAFAYLVDLWGDVPYTQALDYENYPDPAYDRGADIYAEVFRLLDEGVADLNATSSISPSTNDMFFPQATTSTTNWVASSIPKWKKTVNALKARYYNHYSKIDPITSANNALAAIAAGTFTSNAEELKVSFGSTNDVGGPWFGFLFGSFGQNNMTISQGFIDRLRNRVGPGVDDPRLAVYVSRNSAGNYVGTPYGKSQVSGASRLGPYVNSNSAPSNIITYSEVKFIEAEANFRLGQFGPAATAFNDAVKASILRVTGAASPAYEAIYANEDAATIQVNGMEKIFNEKYIAMFLQVEAWSDWRRTIPAGAPGTTSGLPTLVAPVENKTNAVFPRRFLYPPSELDNNSADIPSALLTDRVFWDL